MFAFLTLYSPPCMRKASLRRERWRWHEDNLPDDLCSDLPLVIVKVEKEVFSRKQIIYHSEKNLLYVLVRNGRS